MLTLEDKFEIGQLMNLYAHIIDRKAFTELDKIFVDQAVFDLRSFQSGKMYCGLTNIIEMMTLSNQHPVAHVATNIVIESPCEQVNDLSSADNARKALEVRVESKGLGIGRNGRVGSVVYKDIVVKVKGEWRIKLRAVQLLESPGSQL